MVILLQNLIQGDLIDDSSELETYFVSRFCLDSRTVTFSETARGQSRRIFFFSTYILYVVSILYIRTDFHA